MYLENCLESKEGIFKLYIWIKCEFLFDSIRMLFYFIILHSIWRNFDDSIVQIIRSRLSKIGERRMNDL